MQVALYVLNLVLTYVLVSGGLLSFYFPRKMPQKKRKMHEEIEAQNG